MATLKMTLPGSPSLSLDIAKLSDSDAKTLFDTANNDLFTKREKAWNGKGILTEIATWGGVKVTIYRIDMDNKYALKKAQLKFALEQLANGSGFDLPGNKLTVYCHSLNQACLGYVLLDKSRNLVPTLILGTAASEKSTTVLVADIVHDYYRPTFSVNSAEKRCLTAVFHEFGHIYHQIMGASYFFALGQLPLLAGKSQGELNGTLADRFGANFPTRPSVAALNDFLKATYKLGRKVSGYAGTHPNEFVAEVFSALLMGVPLDQDVLDAYAALGGPAVSGGMVHVRKGQSWTKRNILYPVTSAILAMGDGT